MPSWPLTQGQDANWRSPQSLGTFKDYSILVHQCVINWARTVSGGPSHWVKVFEDRTSHISEDHPADCSSPGVCISCLSLQCGKIQTTVSLLASLVSSVHPDQGHLSHSHCAAITTTHLQLPLILHTETLCPLNNGCPLPPPPSPWQPPFYLLSLWLCLF